MSHSNNPMFPDYQAATDDRLSAFKADCDNDHQQHNRGLTKDPVIYTNSPTRQPSSMPGCHSLPYIELLRHLDPDNAGYVFTLSTSGTFHCQKLNSQYQRSFAQICLQFLLILPTSLQIVIIQLHFGLTSSISLLKCQMMYT